MNKVIQYGRVAVIYSPGWGSGWSTENPNHPECMFDPETVAWVENNFVGPMPDFAAKWGECFNYHAAEAQELLIFWVPVGSLFRVNNYDGSEGVEVFNAEKNWFTA
jgi:hypothetical protein